MSKPSDFVNVQLSPAGEAIANGAPLRITMLHMNYEFAAGKPVRVLTSEWAKVLSTQMVKGALIFELAPPAAAVAQAQTAQAQEEEK